MGPTCEFGRFTGYLLFVAAPRYTFGASLGGVRGNEVCSTHADGIVGFLEDVLDVLLRLQPVRLVGVALFSAPLHLL